MSITTQFMPSQIRTYLSTNIPLPPPHRKTALELQNVAESGNILQAAVFHVVTSLRRTVSLVTSCILYNGICFLYKSKEENFTIMMTQLRSVILQNICYITTWIVHSVLFLCPESCLHCKSETSI